MGHRYNERNIGDYTLDGELKKRTKKPKKITRSFTEGEFELLSYFINKIADNLELDTETFDEQMYVDNGNILITFSRDKIDDLRSVLEKF